MNVICRDSGEKRPREQCFKAPNKKYYTSEEAYMAVVRQTEWKNKCTQKMQDILNYDYDMKLPTSWYKFLKEWTKFGFDVVYETLEVNEKTFKWALETKSFMSDTHALLYFKAIIQNNIMVQYRAKIAREKAALQNRIDEHIVQSESINIKEMGQKSVQGKDLSNLVGSFL